MAFAPDKETVKRVKTECHRLGFAGISPFCVAHKLDYSHFYKIARGERPISVSMLVRLQEIGFDVAGVFGLERLKKEAGYDPERPRPVYAPAEDKPKQAADPPVQAPQAAIRPQMEVRYVPRVTAAARATFTNHYADLLRVESMDVYPVAAGAPGALAFDVVGDSMEPELSHGDVLLADPVSRADWRYMQGGRIYVVLLRDALLVKRARWTDDGRLALASANPAHGEEIASPDDILALWRAVAVNRLLR